MRIDINADLGEGFPFDDELLKWVTSANIACGVHAGDPELMRRTAEAAVREGVALGAHPGLRDGRREIALSPQEAFDLTLDQVRALQAIAGRLRHVKAHGALYNMAVRDATLADAVARATASVDRSLILFGLPGSELIAAGTRAGLRTAREGFADRAYRPDGTLVRRSDPGAVIEDQKSVVKRAISMARDRAVNAIDGSRVALEVETICVHGDTPGAAVLASRIRKALIDAGVSVLPVGAPSGVS